jgi:hypothetical protein
MIEYGAGWNQRGKNFFFCLKVIASVINEFFQNTAAGIMFCVVSDLSCESIQNMNQLLMLLVDGPYAGIEPLIPDKQLQVIDEIGNRFIHEYSILN